MIADSPRKHRILFLAACPTASSQLALEEECDQIEVLLRASRERDLFEFRAVWAASVDKMMYALNDLKPAVIHFSGHGTPRSETVAERNFGTESEEASILLHGVDEHGLPVGAEGLAKMIRSTSRATRIVVLNACYSEALGRSLSETIDCVVGMRGAVMDTAAQSFSADFYRALGFGASIGNAIEQARAAFHARQGHERDSIVCHTRADLSPDSIRLEPPLTRSPPLAQVHPFVEARGPLKPGLGSVEDLFAQSVAQYPVHRIAANDMVKLMQEQLARWIDQHRFHTLRLHDHWRTRATRHEPTANELAVGLEVPVHLEAELCRLKISVRWRDKRYPAIFVGLAGPPWSLAIRRRDQNTQAESGKNTGYLWRSFNAATSSDDVHELLDELEDAASLARTDTHGDRRRS